MSLNVQDNDNYTIVKDPRGRVIFVQATDQTELPTIGIPSGSLAWNPSTSVFHSFSSGSWSALSLTQDITGDVTGNLIGNVTGNVTGTHTGPTVVNGADLTGTALRVARKRATVAELNAGVAFLPAVAGQGYTAFFCKMIAIGGAVTTVATVNVLGTQSAGSVKLFQGAQAALTQNTVCTSTVPAEIAELGAGLTGVACDDNTAITLGITGADITVATHVDVTLFYSIST